MVSHQNPTLKIILSCRLIAKKLILKFGPICNPNIAFCFSEKDVGHECLGPDFQTCWSSIANLVDVFSGK